MSKNQIMDIQKSNNGYPENDFWISKNLAEFFIAIIRILDIQCSIYGYPKIDFRISKKSIFVHSKIILDIHNYFVISQNILLDIQK